MSKPSGFRSLDSAMTKVGLYWNDFYKCPDRAKLLALQVALEEAFSVARAIRTTLTTTLPSIKEVL